MKKYYAINLSEQDGPMRAPVYRASDVDALIAEWLKMCDDHANSSEPVTSPASRAAFRAVATFIRGSLTD